MAKKKRESTGVELLDDFQDLLDGIGPAKLRNVIHCATRVEIALRWSLGAKQLLADIRKAIDESGGDMGQHPEISERIDVALRD